MSAITGSGYGSSHTWITGDTRQARNPEDRATYYHCEKCEVAFMHYYHVTHSIFEAMKQSGIKDQCTQEG